MADVTGGTPPTNASPFAVPDDIKAVYDHFGAQSEYSVATAASLPATGNWVGRTLHIADIDVLAQCTALPGTWRRWYPIHAMEQGTVACPTVGGGSASGWSALIDVTFTASRFSVAPHVKAVTIGPAGQVTMGGAVVEQVTASGCKVRALRIGSEPNELFSVQWTAIQMTSSSAVG